jgi:hypothetical protein
VSVRGHGLVNCHGLGGQLPSTINYGMTAAIPTTVPPVSCYSWAPPSSTKRQLTMSKYSFDQGHIARRGRSAAPDSSESRDCLKCPHYIPRRRRAADSGVQ